MTIAVDIKTGAVVGQAVNDPLPLTIGGVSLVRLLTKDGVYTSVPRSTVRLEKVS